MTKRYTTRTIRTDNLEIQLVTEVQRKSVIDPLARPEMPDDHILLGKPGSELARVDHVEAAVLMTLLRHLPLIGFLDHRGAERSLRPV